MTLLCWFLALLIWFLSPFELMGSGASSNAGQSGTEPGAHPAPSTVTRADNGRTMTLPVGSRFLLALGDGAWTVQVSDPSIIARVPNITVVRGAQGIFVAKRTGRATLSASLPTGTAFRIAIVVT